MRFTHRSYPLPAKLIGQNNVEGVLGPRELILLALYPGISHGFLPIDEETDAVGMNLGGIRVPLVHFDFRTDGLLGFVGILDVKRVVRVDRLMCLGLEVDVFHDIYLGIVRMWHPRVRHQPQRRPEAFRTVEAGTNLEPCHAERLLMMAPDAACDKRSSLRSGE